MSKICTSIEQSKKLLELGLNPDTADMCYCPIMDIDSMSNTGFLKIPDCHPFSEVKDCKVQYLPAWSLSALLDFLKNNINNHSTYEMVYLPSTFDGRGKHLYNTFRFSIDDTDFQKDVYTEDALDAVFEMVKLLFEEKKL